MALTAKRREELAFSLGNVFKPIHPINREDLFAGRTDQIREIVDVVNQPGQHAVLYGERGVGKTSLANMIVPKLYHASMPVLAPHVNCMTNDDFSAAWRRLFGEIVIQQEMKHEIDLTEELTLILRDCTDNFRPIDPDLVRKVLWDLGRHFVVVCVLDEFDTIEDFDARRTMADTVKFLSDRNVPATVVLIGVSDDVENLIENHRSVERCMSQIYMPRMSRDELESIINHGLSACGMEIQPGALHEISRLSRGLPHYTHLLGLYSARAALDAGTLKVKEMHVVVAAEKSLTKAQFSIQSDYAIAVTSSREEAKYRESLLACAMAPTDDLGYFYPKDVREPLQRILKKEVRIPSYQKHIEAFCEETRGAVLKADRTTARPRYRFSNPLLEPYVVIRGLAENLISEHDLRETRDKKDPQMRMF